MLPLAFAVVIIGGLVRTDVSDTRTKVPVLSKIPIVGAAFRHKDKTNNQRELVIFITPHLFKEGQNNTDTLTNITKVISPTDISSKRLELIDRELSTFEYRK